MGGNIVHTNDQARERAESEADEAMVRAYQSAGCPYGTGPDGLARWLTERIARVNQGRRNPQRNPKTDPRIQRGG